MNVLTERLKEIIERRSPSLRWGEAKAIAAELLAAREAQSVPIAFTHRCEISNMQATGLYLRAWPADRRLNESEGYTIPLFTATPVPAVVDFKALAETLVDNLVDCGGVNEDVVNQYLTFAENTCRAAMLVVEPVKPGYRLPDGWIRCSEKMPVKGERLLVYIDFNSNVVPNIMKDAEYTGSTFRIGPNTVNTEGEPRVTHWQPLPAAPKGVTNE